MACGLPATASQLMAQVALPPLSMATAEQSVVLPSMNITEPAQTAKASTALEAVITDVRMGRKGVSEYQAALELETKVGASLTPLRSVK